MRRAMPYPCKAPSTSRVLSTISASVPCRTSVFSFMTRLPFGFLQVACHTPLLESNRAMAEGHQPYRYDRFSFLVGLSRRHNGMFEFSETLLQVSLKTRFFVLLQKLLARRSMSAGGARGNTSHVAGGCPITCTRSERILEAV